VITGAGSGIGRALALEMSRQGMNLALVDINEDGLTQTQAMITDSKLTVSCHVVDVTDIKTLEALPQAVLAVHRSVDVLVNNAGVTCVKSFFEQSMDDFDWVMNVNFNAVVRGTKLFLPYLMRRPEAHIINMSSIFGIVGVPGQTSYCASKFAVRGFSESLQEELTNTPIGVTVVHPGGVATRVVENARTSDEAIKSGMVRAFKRHAIHPDEAARHIVEALRKKRPRLVLTREAMIGDLIKRVFPVWGNRFFVWLLIRMLGMKPMMEALHTRAYESASQQPKPIDHE
jgi:short-subunit dehydrogenase